MVFGVVLMGFVFIGKVGAISFEIIDSQSEAALIDLPNTYDYAASAMTDDDGKWKVWTCNGEDGHDVINLTKFSLQATYEMTPRKVMGQRWGL